ncbi:hypothetical protein CGCTS75_v014748 [Colletotrichum tropicale]|nr:hypothetical protein CGCTS75_v014748 [Colletotrichum tropicale]
MQSRKPSPTRSPPSSLNPKPATREVSQDQTLSTMTQTSTPTRLTASPHVR